MAKTRKKKQSDTIHIDINSHNARGTKYKALSEVRRGELNSSDLKDGTEFFYNGMLYTIEKTSYGNLHFIDEWDVMQGFLSRTTATGFYVGTWFWNKTIKTFIKYKDTQIRVKKEE